MTDGRFVRGGSNMLRILSILLFLQLFLTCQDMGVAWAYSGIVPADPAAEPGKCLYRGDLLELGIHTGPAPCQRLICQKDGSILVEGCGKLWLENCNRGERKYYNKPYPECCKLIYKCKRDDGSPYYLEKDSYQNEVA